MATLVFFSQGNSWTHWLSLGTNHMTFFIEVFHTRYCKWHLYLALGAVWDSWHLCKGYRGDSVADVGEAFWQMTQYLWGVFLEASGWPLQVHDAIPHHVVQPTVHSIVWFAQTHRWLLHFRTALWYLRVLSHIQYLLCLNWTLVHLLPCCASFSS